MQFLTPAIAAAALLAAQVSPGLAQTTTPPAASAPVAPAPAPAPAPATPPSTTIPETTAPPAATPAPRPMKHAKRMTLHQRFVAANTTQDGHLTRDQATAAKWTYVARHFDSMDKEHKGYVTEADIHAYARAQHAARRAAAKTNAPAAVPAEPTTPAPAAPAQ